MHGKGAVVFMLYHLHLHISLSTSTIYTVKMNPDQFIDPQEQIFKFVSNLQVGDKFTLSKAWGTIEVVSKSKDGSLKLNINGKNKRLIFKYGNYYGTMGKGVDWADQLWRDIEGVIIVDNINANNPFHEKSVFSQ